MQPVLQDIINRINQVNNILVTVKANPTVDELAAALALTMALNNFGKHATAVFSGQIPNAMSFLKPQKTFENNVHSLRDFIISLNKEKADKLRFAKDGEIVKIYITPYKSTITANDLQYSEGDFNVEMVIAIGINVKEELDTVIAAHGRILHEATVSTIMAGPTPSQLGSINWSDPTLSSASAMTLQLLQSLNNPNLLSPEVSTALLTGIVADTDRFSNSKTTPRVMELSAQLMNSGADHQLVTSSIAGTGILPNSAPTPTPSNPQPTEANQELVLDLHTPAPQTQPSIVEQTQPATNTSPMVNTPPEVMTQQPEVVPSESITPPQTQAPATPLSEPVAQLLPQPVDPAQTVLPADLLPPQPSAATVQTEITPTSSPVLDPVESLVAAENPANPIESSDPEIVKTETNEDTPAPTQEAEQIRSEIDKIYSAEPFDPANNPRQDLGTDIVMPTEDHIQELGAPALTVDTTVQSTQADPTLKPIEATKDEVVDANTVFGSDLTENPSMPEIPGLEMPPEISPPNPPTPPNPLMSEKSSSIDTEPFGNTINFDPTKPANNAS